MRFSPATCVPAAPARPRHHRREKGLNSRVIAAIAIGAVLVFVAALLVALWLFHRRMQRLRMGRWFDDVANGPGGAELMSKLNRRAVRIIPLEQIIAATEGFSEQRLLGRGAFGAIYRGDYQGQQVAVKRARTVSHDSMVDFMHEVELISQLHHVNLLHMIGFCTENGEQIFVMEYMENGTVHDHLFPPPGATAASLTFAQRLEIAVGAARGLNYLHSFAAEPVIHRDVKTENILLDGDLKPKMADFGLLKKIEQDEDKARTVKIVGTRGYLDPEYYTTFRVTPKSDVFSFGVVLLQLISGKPPVLDNPENAEQSISLVAWVRLQVEGSNWDAVPDPRMVFEKTKAQDQVSDLQKLLIIALDCLELHGNDRPTMAEVQNRLEELLGGDIKYDFDRSPEAKSESNGPSEGGSFQVEPYFGRPSSSDNHTSMQQTSYLVQMPSYISHVSGR